MRLTGASAVIALGFVACGSPPPPPRPVIPVAPTFTAPEVAYANVPGGLVATKGVRVVAEDGSFELTAEKPFEPPFHQGATCLVEPIAENSEQGEITGARRVRVYVPAADAKEQVLYGLLSLCGAPPDATGAATRRYALQVPQSYIDATEGGRVSVVYEPFVDLTRGNPSKAWILWLSQTPFPNPRPNARGGLTSELWEIEQARLAFEQPHRSGSAGRPVAGAIVVGAQMDAKCRAVWLHMMRLAQPGLSEADVEKQLEQALAANPQGVSQMCAQMTPAQVKCTLRSQTMQGFQACLQ